MRFVHLFCLAFFAPCVWAQAPAPIRAEPNGAVVRGIVRDSISRSPLVGAVVQLAAADSLGRYGRAVHSDSLGRFAFVDVPDGRYVLGFFHPVVDSLGLELPLREVLVDRHRPVNADLTTPSADRLRAMICGPRSASSAVVVGVVRETGQRAPVSGVTVVGEWLELSFSTGSVNHRRPRLVTSTQENGWFAICNVPKGGTMYLMAHRGADSTDRVEVLVPANGFLRRELYLGAAQNIVDRTAPTGVDSTALVPVVLRRGDGRLSGTVVTADGGRPLAGAQVSLAEGPKTRTNDEGQWVLADAPGGTRILEIRALGYYPERRSVDVIPGALPVRVALSTFKAVLDAVKVTASRNADSRFSGFEDRRRKGAGRYYTAAEIYKSGAMFLWDFFRTVPGIQSLGPDDVLKMRGIDVEPCTPAIFVNGLFMTNLTSEDIDRLVGNIKKVTGVEVYSETSAPPNFQEGRTGCGSIVMWTK